MRKSLKVVGSDGVAIDEGAPLMSALCARIRECAGDFPEAEVVEVPYPAARINALYQSIIGPGPVLHDDELEDYLGLATGRASYLTLGHANGSRCIAWRQLTRDKFRPTRAAADKALIAGCLVCMKYLHANKFLWRAGDAECAAIHGHIECLAFLHERGCPWDAACTYAAAKNGHFQCLAYAHEHGCPWNGLVAVAAVENSAALVKTKSRECLKYYCENAGPDRPGKLPVQCAHVAAERGDLETLAYLREHGCELDALCAPLAGMRGYVECMNYLCAINPPGTDCTLAAVRYRRIDCLGYLRRYNCPWDSRCYDVAEELGDTGLVEFLRANGCPERHQG